MAVSFKLTSTSKPKELLKGAIEDHATVPVENERDYVTSVSKNKIQSTKPEPVKKEVVIPCQKDGFKVALEISMKEKSDLEAAAISAVLKDAESFGSKEQEAGEQQAKTLMIPAVATSEVTTDDDNKIARQVVVGDAADYDAVSIDDFGMAMLRGMGFNESEGIGKTNKQTVKPLEVQVRPKGQGLGAGMSRTKMPASSSQNGKEEQEEAFEEVELRTGVKCMVLNGPHKEKYATVEGLDAENSRVIIRLALGDKVLSMPESNVKPVSDREFQRYSRYLNKASADVMRKETEKKLMEMRTHSPPEESADRGRKHEKKSPRSRSRSHSSDRKHHHHHGKSKHHHRQEKEEIPRWLHPHLSVVVRSGKYVDQRGSVSDVLTPTTCTLRLHQGGKTLYDMEASQLIPVQPRRVGDACMALVGENRRLIGRIIEIDGDGRYAAVQSAADEMVVVSEKLSNLCIYTGSLDF